MRPGGCAGRLPQRKPYVAVVCGALLALLLSGCPGYGGTTFETPAGGRVKTEDEHCAATLPEGWTWRPASWTAVSPLGTHMSFGENLLGRPRFPEWDELVDSEMADTARPGAQVTKTDSELRIDFGPDGGLSVITRFDDVACQVTFSYVKDARASEGAAWEEIIASVERTSLAT